ncbi:MAG: hypothetical protein R3F59_07415 [Myxococcota bacterium]
MTPDLRPLLVLTALATLGASACRDQGKDPTGDDDDDDTTTAPAVLSVGGEASSASEASLPVEVSGTANVAAACVRRDRPAEVHLLESQGSGNLDFKFVGLAADTDYDCSVALVDGSGEPHTVSLHTMPLDSNAATAHMIGDPSAMTGVWTLTTVRPECSGNHQNYLTVLDPEGGNRWSFAVPRKLNLGTEARSDGPNRVLYGGGDDPAGPPTVVDLQHGEQWRLEFPGSDEVVFHHDAKRIADGRVLSLELNEDPGWEAFQLRLSNDDMTTSWYWDVADHTDWLDPGEDSDDPHHANWADVVDGPDGLTAYVSLCYAFKIVAIDVATSQPAWRFGYGGDFTLEDPDGNPLPQDEFPQCQHGVSTDGTNLLVYDNGFDRGYTRAVEYRLDTVRKVATKTWEWRDEGYWEKYHGGASWLTDDHDRVLVAEANNDCGDTSDRPTQIVELDRAAGTEIHRLVFDDVGKWIYNAHRVDGCDLFANAEYCPAVATRLDELRGALGL